MTTWSKDAASIIKACWATPEGNKALQLICQELAGIHNPSFDTNPHVMAFNEGRRAIGIELAQIINTPMDKLALEDKHGRATDTGHPITATERAARAAVDRAVAAKPTAAGAGGARRKR